MNKIEKNKVPYLTFNLLEKEGVKHGFSTRLGGVSTGVYESMNLGFSRGDDADLVRENYRRLTKAMNISYDRMCMSMQGHTTNVLVVDEKDAGNGIIKPKPYENIDGLITNTKDMPLVIYAADCMPLFFYDPVNKVIGAAHSGWRGTVGKIAKVTIEKMHDNFGSRPEDILCCIGPSICKNCYEVSREVADEFIRVFGKENSDRILSQSIFNPDDPDKFMLDLWEAARLTFEEADIPNNHIETTDYCTRCYPELFYSHRIMGNARGSMAGFISL